MPIMDQINLMQSLSGQDLVDWLVLQHSPVRGSNHWSWNSITSQVGTPLPFSFQEVLTLMFPCTLLQSGKEMAYIILYPASPRLPILNSFLTLIGTPLTNVRYISNYRGAIYGWDQTLNNSGQNRLLYNTPVKNLYLSGAWSRPGHGYRAVVSSGLDCFAEIMNNW